MWPGLRDSWSPKPTPKTLCSHWWVLRARPASLTATGAQAPKDTCPHHCLHPCLPTALHWCLTHLQVSANVWAPGKTQPACPPR